MNNINWEQLSISFQYKTGQISEKKADKIVGELKSIGIVVDAVMRPSPDAAIFMLDNSGCVFIIMPENVAYNIPNIKNRFNIAKKHLNAIVEVLSVEDEILFVANAQGNTETENSHIQSYNRFNQKFENSLDQYTDIYGVGYRFLIKNDLYSGEIKIEPMVIEPSKYYYQYIINALSGMSVDSFSELVSACLDKDYELLREVL